MTVEIKNSLEQKIKQLVPMIGYTQMEIVALTEAMVTVKIPCIQENKNHLNSLYFGALSVGADVAGGILALYYAEKSRQKVSIVFKDFKAEFLKRAEADTFFVCEDGLAIEKLMATAIETKERQNLSVNVTAFTDDSDQPVAKFVLTLSVKLAKSEPVYLEPEVNFTEAAASKVQSLIVEEENPALCLRVFITGGGCSGFQYGFTFDEEIKEDDYVLDKPLSDNAVVRLLIDAMSYQYLQGADIDYREDVNGSQFIIRNPNAKTTCGCGSSFST